MFVYVFESSMFTLHKDMFLNVVSWLAVRVPIILTEIELVSDWFMHNNSTYYTDNAPDIKHTEDLSGFQ